MATQAEFDKLLQLGSLASNASWLDPMAGGSRSQETQARKAVKQFNALGGQTELDRLRSVVLSDPIYAQQYSSLQNRGGFLGAGFWDVAKPAALFAGGVGLAKSAGLLGAGTGAGAAGAGAGAVQGMTAAELAAADPYLASIGGAGSVTGGMETAGMLSAAGAPGVAASTAAGNVATGLGYDTLGTAATGAGLTGTTAPGISQIAQQVTQGASGTPAVDQVAKTPTTTGASWLDYLSTGLGLTQGIQQLTGGTSLDANAIRNMVDPFAPYRGQYAEQLNQLMTQPSTVTTLPGYQFLQQQGQQAVQRALAAQGRTVSGQEQLALQEQDQGLANRFYNEQYQKLAQLSGANANPAAGGTAAADTMTQNLNQNQAGWGTLGTLVAGGMTPNTPVSRTVGSISNMWR